MIITHIKQVVGVEIPVSLLHVGQPAIAPAVSGVPGAVAQTAAQPLSPQPLSPQPLSPQPLAAQPLAQAQFPASFRHVRAGAQMGVLPCLEDAYICIDQGVITEIGPMSACPPCEDEVLDAKGGFVFPSFCDCHTHLVYAGSREREFVDKIRGLTYQEIAQRGGGILNSAKLLHETSEEALYDQALPRLDEIIRFGTGAVEIKSGYGLTVEDELKMLRVIRRIGEQGPLTVRATFLGAHAIPQVYRQQPQAYVDLMIDKMIPMVASEQLAQYIDVFCEDGFFSVEDTERLLEAGLRYGLRPRLHANQMGFSGGVQTGVKYQAVSVDHLEHTGAQEIALLAQSWGIDPSSPDGLVLHKAGVMPVMLPGATFFMEMAYAPARAMLQSGLPLALATNYNPGSCPAGDMRFMMSLACLKLKMTPEEAIQAATINGAWVMGLDQSLGSIAVGKKANLFITKTIPSYDFMPYAFCSPLIDTIILNGQIY